MEASWKPETLGVRKELLLRVWILVAGWAGLIASSPWIIRACHFADLTGVTALLGLIVLAAVPTFLFGFTLGYVRVWKVIAASAGLGAAVCLINIAALRDPNMGPDTVGAFLLGYFFILVPFVECPLFVGAGFGTLCRIGRRGRRGEFSFHDGSSVC